MLPRRRLRIEARALFEALTARHPSVLGSYLDLRTGAVFQLLDPVATGLDNEAVEAAMDQEPDRYALVPVYDREYRLMCAFVDEVDDEDLAAELDQALRGPTAFRGFHGLLEANPTVADRWRAYREDALSRWALAWLANVGVTPDWDHPVDAEPAALPAIGLHHLLLLGGDPGAGADGAVRRALHAASVAEARKLFKRFVRQLCEYRGEPWRGRYVRDVATFERDGVRLRQVADRVEIELRVEPDVLARFRSMGG